MSSYAESFPLNVVEEGKNIDYNKPINLFNGVKLISHFLEKRYKVDPDLISEVKLTELLELFKNQASVTVSELFNHVSKMFTEDEGSLSKKLTTETEKF